MLSFQQALDTVLANMPTIQGSESLFIRAALHRVLDEDILSPINVPGYDNSAMDGYALNSADLPSSDSTQLQVCGESFAGHPYEGEIPKGCTIRIMTGAQMPQGADTIIMQEQVERSEDLITIEAGHTAGSNVRKSGEDLQCGQLVFGKGHRLSPADLGLLASLGIAEVKVKRPLRVAIFSTGDELRSIGQTLEEGQIYDSNRYTIAALLQETGYQVQDLGIIADERARVEEAFEQAGKNADIVITSGGVSVGEADYIKETLEKAGTVHFWKLAIKPGKPLAFGTLGNAMFFGLPGNPVSAMITFLTMVRPALAHATGQQAVTPLKLQLPCSSALKKRPGRLEFQRGIMFLDDSGQICVRSTGHQGSHILRSMSEANCLIMLPAEQGNCEPGHVVEVWPLSLNLTMS